MARLIDLPVEVSRVSFSLSLGSWLTLSERQVTAPHPSPFTLVYPAIALSSVPDPVLVDLASSQSVIPTPAASFSQDSVARDQVPDMHLAGPPGDRTDQPRTEGQETQVSSTAPSTLLESFPLSARLGPDSRPLAPHPLPAGNVRSVSELAHWLSTREGRVLGRSRADQSLARLWS